MVISRVVYQKAYVEFFISPEDFEDLKPKIEMKESLTYMAATSSGELVTNAKQDNVNAVTWGVFPGEQSSAQLLRETFMNCL